jgi:hypothetical protein
VFGVPVLRHHDFDICSSVVLEASQTENMATALSIKFVRFALSREKQIQRTGLFVRLASGRCLVSRRA